MKYGHEALEVLKRMTNKKNLPLPKHQIYFHLGHASQCIEKYDDATIYFNHRINSCLEAHHKSEIDDLDLLTAFESQIESLVEAKMYGAAMNVMEQINVYNLNSNEVGDVMSLFMTLKEHSENILQRDKCIKHSLLLI